MYRKSYNAGQKSIFGLPVFLPKNPYVRLKPNDVFY